MYSSKPGDLPRSTSASRASVRAHTFRLHFQNSLTAVPEVESSSRIAIKPDHMSRSFALASTRFFVRWVGFDKVAPRCRWKMSFLES